MRYYVGMDLHSDNTVIAISDEEDNRLYSRRVVNNMENIRAALEPFREAVEGIVVESTFNWYWLVDGLQESGYRVHLANPVAMVQYNGFKHTDDKHDAFFLAKLLRLGILPEGYIYPREGRQVRDLLRKRMLLVQSRTAQVLSLKGTVSRNLGTGISLAALRKLTQDDIGELFDNDHLAFSASISLQLIRYLDQQISVVEKKVLETAYTHPLFEQLMTPIGIGKILAMTILYETGDISRFSSVGNYASYSRCVTSNRISNGKTKGQNNRKNGNKYLAWAYVEAAHLACHYCLYAKAFYEKKKKQKNSSVATKALAHKIARACYYIMKDNKPFDLERMYENALIEKVRQHTNKVPGLRATVSDQQGCRTA